MVYWQKILKRRRNLSSKKEQRAEVKDIITEFVAAGKTEITTDMIFDKFLEKFYEPSPHQQHQTSYPVPKSNRNFPTLNRIGQFAGQHVKFNLPNWVWDRRSTAWIKLEEEE